MYLLVWKEKYVLQICSVKIIFVDKLPPRPDVRCDCPRTTRSTLLIVSLHSLPYEVGANDNIVCVMYVTVHRV